MVETKLPQDNRDNVQASRVVIVLLVFISLCVAGPITVSVHDAVHVLCGAEGECFGAARWVEGISMLPFWNLLLGAWATVLFCLSALSYRFMLPRIWVIQQGLFAENEKEAFSSLGQLKKAALLCLFFSSVVWVGMLIVSLSLYNG